MNVKLSIVGTVACIVVAEVGIYSTLKGPREGLLFAQGGEDGNEDYCSGLTDEEKGLFTVYSLAGSSNTYHDENNNPYGVGDRTQYYQGKILSKAWEKLGGCVDYEPEMWIIWYTDVGEIPDNTTLLMAVDAFFHYLDDDPDPETFRARVRDYLTTIHNIAPTAPFFAANIPQALMFSYTGDKQEINDIIAEELGAYNNYCMLDIDSHMSMILNGQMMYDGEVVNSSDILQDPLHLNEYGHQLVADLYINLLNETYPNLKLSTYGQVGSEGGSEEPSGTPWVWAGVLIVALAAAFSLAVAVYKRR